MRFVDCFLRQRPGGLRLAGKAPVGPDRRDSVQLRDLAQRLLKGKEVRIAEKSDKPTLAMRT